MGDDEPKYLNSPETPLFHKGRSLYGLYEARQVHGRPEQILIVEGYLELLGAVIEDVRNLEKAKPVR